MIAIEKNKLILAHYLDLVNKNYKDLPPEKVGWGGMEFLRIFDKRGGKMDLKNLAKIGSVWPHYIKTNRK